MSSLKSEGCKLFVHEERKKKKAEVYVLLFLFYLMRYDMTHKNHVIYF